MADSRSSEQEDVLRAADIFQTSESTSVASLATKPDKTWKGGTSTSSQYATFVVHSDVLRKSVSSGSIQEFVGEHDNEDFASAKDNQDADNFESNRFIGNEAPRDNKWTDETQNISLREAIMPKEDEWTLPQKHARLRTTTITKKKASSKHKRQNSLLEWKDAQRFEFDGHIR